MKTLLTLLLLTTSLGSPALAQNLAPMKSNQPYIENGHERHVLDIYAPANASNLPVLFWIHGGGWQSGDKTSVHLKPQYFTDQGFVFVSINHRLLPDVVMEDIIADVAQAFAWMHQHIAQYGGNPQRVVVGGHSSGAQLAALLCTDHRYLEKHAIPLSLIKGCIPVDGDTFDIPAIIETAETRRRAHQQSLPTFGHRQKFGHDPAKHVNFSAVTHIVQGKAIPPFFILHVADHPDNSAQAVRLETVLKDANLPVTRYGAKETNHSRINANLGLPDDPSTQELNTFLGRILKP
jgi:acetyl esterase/lipase